MVLHSDSLLVFYGCSVIFEIFLLVDLSGLPVCLSGLGLGVSTIFLVFISISYQVISNKCTSSDKCPTLHEKNENVLPYLCFLII